MNCIDTRENLVLQAEGALDPATAAEVARHLAACPSCRAEGEAMNELHSRLAARAETAAGVALATPVMARIRSSATGTKARPPSLYLRWLLGLGTVAAAAAVLTLVALPPAMKAADVMQRGIAAAARLTTVHLKARMRTPPADNFASLNASGAFSPIEMWKELDGLNRWRVEKPGRVAAMDGETTLLFIRTGNTALRVPRPTRDAFDTGWLHAMADIEQTLTRALKQAQEKGWKMEVTRQTDAAGVVHALVTIDAVTGVPAGDYLTNKFFDLADSRRVYRFDDSTGALEAVQVYLRQDGDLRLIFEVTEIEYNQPLAADAFKVALPADVAWMEGPQPVANNALYAAMSSQQAARTFFEACARQDWTVAQVFMPMPLNDRIKQALGGLTLLNLGEPFTSAASPAQFVPYEIQLPGGEVKKHNLALKKHPRAGRWVVDGGL